MASPEMLVSLTAVEAMKVASVVTDIAQLVDVCDIVDPFMTVEALSCNLFLVEVI